MTKLHVNWNKNERTSFKLGEWIQPTLDLELLFMNHDKKPTVQTPQQKWIKIGVNELSNWKPEHAEEDKEIVLAAHVYCIGTRGEEKHLLQLMWTDHN